MGPSELFAFVPKLGELGFRDLEMSGSPPLSGTLSETGVKLVSDTSFRVRCWTEDRRRLVQITPDRLIVNNVVTEGTDYPGWLSFRKDFELALATYEDHVGQLGVEVLELGTIDEISQPAETFRLGSILNCGGQRIPGWYADCKIACDMSLGMGFLKVDRTNDHYKVRVRPASGDQMLTRIESHFVLALEAGADSRIHLDDLHAKSNRHFEELITDYTREEVMGGTSV